MRHLLSETLVAIIHLLSKTLVEVRPGKTLVEMIDLLREIFVKVALVE